MQPAHEKDRIEPRTRAMVRARMRDSRGERDICIINLSTRGLLATTAMPPARGEIVELMIGRNHLTGQVRWASERRFGVSLRERVSVVALAEGGAGQAALASSASGARRRSTTLAGLRENPEWLGRMGQQVAMAMVAGLAGVFLFSLMGDSLAPIARAMADAGR